MMESDGHFFDYQQEAAMKEFLEEELRPIAVAVVDQVLAML